MSKRWTRCLFGLGSILIVLYVGSYFALSRRGYTEAERFNMRAFYYFTPENTRSWRQRNQACVYLFWHLNIVDQWLGFGKAPASEPLWGLSR
jgi:hypothetical protein